MRDDLEGFAAVQCNEEQPAATRAPARCGRADWPGAAASSSVMATLAVLLIRGKPYDTPSYLTWRSEAELMASVVGPRLVNAMANSHRGVNFA